MTSCGIGGKKSYINVQINGKNISEAIKEKKKNVKYLLYL